jgi:hypothetical protein
VVSDGRQLGVAVLFFAVEEFVFFLCWYAKPIKECQLQLICCWFIG